MENAVEPLFNLLCIERPVLVLIQLSEARSLLLGEELVAGAGFPPEFFKAERA